MIKINKASFIFLFLISLQPAFSATELARVDNTVITLEDFNKKYQENLKFFQMKAPKKRDVLEDLIKRESQAWQL